MITYKTTIDRYCPSKEHNVKIEIAQHDDGSVTERCLWKECQTSSCSTYRDRIESRLFSKAEG